MPKSREITLSLGSDHAGFELKFALKERLAKQGIKIIDRGTENQDSVDYPDFAELVAKDVLEGDAAFGILVCSTGIGISISANKIKGIRAALVYNEDAARYSKSHNDANILCFGAKYQTVDSLEAMINAFLDTEFEGGRHSRRIGKIDDLEKKG